MTSTPSSTNYWCQAGFYCPWDAAQNKNLPCKRCPQQSDEWECSQTALESKAKGEWF